MPPPDSKSLALRVGLYAFFYGVTLLILSHLLLTLGGYLLSGAGGTFLAAVTTNVLTLRIYERRSLADIGLRWNGDSLRNLLWGFGAGAGTAVLVLGGALAAGLAQWEPSSQAQLSPGGIIFVLTMLLTGSAGEEICFRGYATQLLMRAVGPFSAIFPVGMVFALLHGSNPHSTYAAILNTAGFGILFGYAFLRSHDVWLPIGLHFGWNALLPLFGANVSGFTMRLTGYEMRWTAGPLWSGGDYGPEASLMTSGALVMLFLFLWKAPVRRQIAPLMEGVLE
ncbi:MAG: lysostaphin resistance A-like protein [Bryobacteraceae bacterium]